MFAKVELINGQGPYVAGEILQGKVFVHKKQHIAQSNLILVEVKGRAETDLGQVSVAVYGELAITRMQGHEDLFHKVTRVYSKERGDGVLRYGPSDSYGFSMFLPRTLPSSFEEEEGKTEYSVGVIFELKDGSKVEDPIVFPFLLKRTIDMRIYGLGRITLTPAVIRATRRFTWLELKRGKIQLQLTIPKRGYVPGEGIPLAVTVTNTTNQNIKKIEATVLQDLWYEYWGGMENCKKMRRMALCRLEGPVVPAGMTVRWFEELRLPTNPSFIRTIGLNCKIIQVEHSLEIRLISGTTFWTKEDKVLLEEKLDLVVGDLPLPMDFIHAHSEPNFLTPINSARSRPMSRNSSVPPPDYACIELENLPTYEEAALLR